LAKQLQRRRFLEIDQSETRMACGGHVYQRMGTKCTIMEGSVLSFLKAE
jgi:hypothetical protein